MSSSGPEWSELHLNESLTGYCFGELPEDDRQRVEEHLMLCDACWVEFQRLDRAVRTLRSAPDLRPVVRKGEIVSLLGMSGRLSRPFAGHRWYAIVISCLFGLLWTVAIWSELGYSYDRFGSLAWMLSGPTGVFAAAVLIFGMQVDIRITRGARSSGLMLSIVAVLGGLGLLVLGNMMLLPSERTILASFETRTASAGFLKDALVIFVPLLVFILPPFDTVIRLQAELAGSQDERVRAILARDADAVWPRGMIFIPPTWLGLVLLVLGVMKIVGANHMLDALTPGPYSHLFAVASYVSTGLWFAVAITALWWYSANLNELRRELLAVRKLSPGDLRRS